MHGLEYQTVPPFAHAEKMAKPCIWHSAESERPHWRSRIIGLRAPPEAVPIQLPTLPRWLAVIGPPRRVCFLLMGTLLLALASSSVALMFAMRSEETNRDAIATNLQQA